MRERDIDITIRARTNIPLDRFTKDLYGIKFWGPGRLPVELYVYLGLDKILEVKAQRARRVKKKSKKT